MEVKPNGDSATAGDALSKSARKKLLKRERQAARKAERRAAEKERRRVDLERRRTEWDEKLAAAPEEERQRLVEERRVAKKERVERRAQERAARADRLQRASECGQKLVIDLDFADLMTQNEIQSLVHQIMYCYAANGRCALPAHLWLTGCQGEIQTYIEKLPGYGKWIIEKDSRSYIEALQDHKENLVYLTADAETVVDELDSKKIYIIGGLVDRNRWKGITLKKANDQGIKSARLPISDYLKLSSSQVLTVNQVVDILLKYLETKDWKNAFFQVIPQRKIGEAGAVEKGSGSEGTRSATEIVSGEDEEAEWNEEGGPQKRPRLYESDDEDVIDTADMLKKGYEDGEELKAKSNGENRQ